jgi:hypothetical protein
MTTATSTAGGVPGAAGLHCSGAAPIAQMAAGGANARVTCGAGGADWVS